ncbi:MAG: AAA family ATPase [Candidatus Competibacteraceae bacterium]|nr:AAA family ATPase [Candidatus Competibacteraceae bacterium]
MTVKPLPSETLYRRCDPTTLPFETTDDLPDLSEVIGQARALDALQFGIGMHRKGYNLYAMGPPGIGKHAVVKRVLGEAAAQESSASDWVYVNNFTDPPKPVALKLHASQGEALRQDMERFLDDLKDSLPTAFDSDEYRSRVKEIEQQFKKRQEEQFKSLQGKAEALDIALLNTPSGFAMAPKKNGKILSPDEFNSLSEEEKERTEQMVAKLQEDVQEIARQMPGWRREHRAMIKALNDEVALSVVGHLMDELRQHYSQLSKVLDYFEAVQQDMLDHLDDFLGKNEDSGPSAVGSSNPALQRYQVNLLVSHAPDKGAPVIYEDNPTFQNLIGRVEYLSQFGTLVTDFTLIKPGALHRANGGYLLLDVRHLFTQPFAWEGLKRALFAQEVRIVSLGEMFSALSTVSLEPQPIPLNIKIVLLGERLFYYLLNQVDPDFRELFKVAADLEEELDRGGDNDQLYAQLIATLARKESLKPLDNGAVARVIEHSARMAEDAEKLSIHMLTVTDLLQESDYWASQDNAKVIKAEHVRQAVEAHRRRSGRVHEKLLEAVQRNIILINTQGEKIGQINALSVIDLGDSRWGQPARITATVRLGSGQVVDIEREVELGGAIHSKGVMILSAFLGARYAGDHPLSLHASLVFEQSYARVDGDSASLAELCALLSALAEVPIQQSFAVTGSVNQQGEVQAIGGVNEKIEGFFDVCRVKGLDGQAVIIPAANRQHLMLREDVVEAAEQDKFRIYAVTTVDEALQLLTGMPVGTLDPTGQFPQDSVNWRVEQRLLKLSKQRQAFAKAEEKAAESSANQSNKDRA